MLTQQQENITRAQVLKKGPHFHIRNIRELPGFSVAGYSVIKMSSQNNPFFLTSPWVYQGDLRELANVSKQNVFAKELGFDKGLRGQSGFQTQDIQFYSERNAKEQKYNFREKIQ